MGRLRIKNSDQAGLRSFSESEARTRTKAGAKLWNGTKMKKEKIAIFNIWDFFSGMFSALSGAFLSPVRFKNSDGRKMKFHSENMVFEFRWKSPPPPPRTFFDSPMKVFFLASTKKILSIYKKLKIKNLFNLTKLKLGFPQSVASGATFVAWSLMFPSRDKNIQNLFLK